MNNNKNITFILMLSILFSPLCDNQDSSSVQSNEIEDLIRSGAKIFDVRTPEEYAEGHYEGAVNIPLNEIESRIDEFSPKDEPIIVYCQSGNRAESARTILIENGYTNVYNAGGLEDMHILETSLR